MSDIENLNRIYGVSKGPDADVGLITSGTFAWGAGENNVTESFSVGYTFAGRDLHPDSLFALAVEKDGDRGAGELTVKTYNRIKVDGTNERDVLVATNVVASTATGTPGTGLFLIQGLGIGQGSFRISMSWAVDTGAINAYYRLYRL